MTDAPRPARRTLPPGLFWLLAVLLLPVIIFMAGIGAGFQSAHVEDGGEPTLLVFLPAVLMALVWAAVVALGFRAVRLRSDDRRWTGPQVALAVCAASVGIVLPLGVLGAFVENVAVSVAARLLAMVLAFGLTLVYWRRIDEAAREAQKSACFWGVGLGVAALGVIEPLVSGSGGSVRVPVLVGEGASFDWLVSGALYLLFAQGLFALVLWGAWWIRAR